MGFCTISDHLLQFLPCPVPQFPLSPRAFKLGEGEVFLTYRASVQQDTGSPSLQKLPSQGFSLSP